MTHAVPKWTTGGPVAARMPGTARGLLACLAMATALLNSCREGPRPESPRLAAPPATVDTGDGLRPGIRFDPAIVMAGQGVGALTVDSVAVVQSGFDSSLVGTVSFKGELALSGVTMKHFDAEPGAAASCFEADATSAARLPRWDGDERRPWFCFDNPADAASLLGATGEGMAFTIVIERFTIHRGHSDQVNTARLLSAQPLRSTSELP